MKFKLSIFLIVFCFSVHLTAYAQIRVFSELEHRLRRGDKTALYEYAHFFDSKKDTFERAYLHTFRSTVGGIVKRIYKENCAFTENELVIDFRTTAKDFYDFWQLDSSRIVFSREINAFIVVPLDKKTAEVAFTKVPIIRYNELKAQYPKMLAYKWVKDAGIDTLILQKNPQALYRIAAELYKGRHTFYREGVNQIEYLELLAVLIKCRIIVEDENKYKLWTPPLSRPALFNLLIYFAGNYKQYTWDDNSQIFRNDNIKIELPGKEDSLFQLLSSKNDSVAIDAFAGLTLLDTAKVLPLAREYESSDIKVLPIETKDIHHFFFRMYAFTTYCREHSIDFLGTSVLRKYIGQLKSDLTFSERRRLEDELIRILTPENVTALEYWAFINMYSAKLNYSIGRVLDIFYSENWKQITGSERYLRHYIEKSYLFGKFPGMGICSYYTEKFTGNGWDIYQRLDALECNDEDMYDHIAYTRSKCMSHADTADPDKDCGDTRHKVRNIEKEIKEVIISQLDALELEDSLVFLLSKADYNQLPAVMRIMEGYEFTFRLCRKYKFIKADHGIFINDDVNLPLVRQEFLKCYDSLSQYQLYAYYLHKAGVDYRYDDGSLDYDKIFDILKYNAVEKFVDVDFSNRSENEVFSIIKLLELTHNTALGYCSHCATVDCRCLPQKRANAWMRYLSGKGLLKKEHSSVVSFHH